MSFINEAKKEINCKIIYFGPAQCGKTTSLQSIFDEVKKRKKGNLVSLAGEGDRTLFFDFVPLNLGKIGDYTMRLHLYTIPGQAPYAAQRKLIAKGADGIVFVADSQLPRMEANIASLRDLEAIFTDEGVEFESMPLVMQYNKQDTEMAAPVVRLSDILNRRQVPEFSTVATKNQGVFDALQAIGEGVLHKLQQDYS